MNVWIKVLRGPWCDYNFLFYIFTIFTTCDYNSGLNKDPHDKQWEILIAKCEIDFDVCQNWANQIKMWWRNRLLCPANKVLEAQRQRRVHSLELKTLDESDVIKIGSSRVCSCLSSNDLKWQCGHFLWKPQECISPKTKTQNITLVYFKLVDSVMKHLNRFGFIPQESQGDVLGLLREPVLSRT